MFDELPSRGFSLASFLVQQVISTLLCSLIGILLALPFGLIEASFYLLPFGVSVSIGFGLERYWNGAVNSGRWVFVVPVLSVLANIHDYAVHEGIRAGLLYTLWPAATPNAGERALGSVLFAIPACSSVGYVAGLFWGRKVNARTG